MKLTKKMLKDFPPVHRQFIRDLYTNGKLLVTKDEGAELPAGVTHILLVRRGQPPQIIRKRMS